MLEREIGIKQLILHLILEKISGVSFRIAISHYFCELATNNLNEQKIWPSKNIP